jgi:hypothetical protein
VTFASSSIPSPHDHGCILRYTVPVMGTIWDYHVSLNKQNGLGSLFPPAMSHPRYQKAPLRYLNRVTILVRACQHIWLLVPHGVYTRVHITLTIPFIPDSSPLCASRFDLFSRTPLRLPAAALSLELHTIALLQSHVQVGNCWRNSRLLLEWLARKAIH